MTFAKAVPDALVRRVCEEVGLDFYRDAHEVLDALEFHGVRQCCDSGCDPCVLTVLRAAEILKRHLATLPQEVKGET